MESKIVVALDFDSERKTLEFVDGVDPTQCRVKVGKELFTRCGPGLVKQLVARNFDVFLDLKFHDIPNTVAHAVTAAADLGVWMTNVHASGGIEMMVAAREAIADLSNGDRPMLIAVTVLTSLSEADLLAIGVTASPADQVLNLARLAKQAGLDGVVCSAAETVALRSAIGPDFCLVTPGIRRPEDATGDQKRVVGPFEAIANGSDYLVIGRPITQAVEPTAALAAFNRLISGAS